MKSTRSTRTAEVRGSVFRVLAAVGLLWSGACGPLHTPFGDGDGDEDVDMAADADADAEYELDADQRRDADRVDAEEGDADADADEDPEVDEDEQYEPTDRTWLLASHPHEYSAVSSVEHYPGGGGVVAGRRGSQWIARLDSAGEPLWSLIFGPGFGRDITSLSVAPDGRIYVGASDRVVALDGDGGVLWQRQTEGYRPVLRGLADGSVIVFNPYDVMRYSPTEGVLWSWHVGPDDIIGQGYAIAVTEEGRLFYAAGDRVVAMDLDGAVLWAARWAGSSSSARPVPVAAVAATEAGGVVIAGGHPPTVVRIDAEGRAEWLRIVGTYREGYLEDDCYPRCLTDVAVDVAVNGLGQVMVVGYSTGANEVVGAAPYTSLMAFWLDAGGALYQAIAMAEPHPTGHSDGLAAAVAESGEWLVGGHFGRERAVLASLDASGSTGGDCSYFGEPTFELPTEAWTLEPIDVTLSPSDLEVVEGEPLDFEPLDAPMEWLCW